MVQAIICNACDSPVRSNAIIMNYVEPEFDVTWEFCGWSCAQDWMNEHASTQTS